MRGFRFWLPVIISLVLTPVCLLLGLASAGVGHGDYFLARILFPVTMISAVIFDSITIPFLILAVAQFPIYGVVLGTANVKSKLPRAAVGVVLAHLLAVAVCFLLTSENFS